ncbi:MAG: hypothetical protein WBA67_03625 [Jannaschia sp.]
MAFAAAAGIFASGVVVMGDMRSNDNAAKFAGDISLASVEFLAQPDQGTLTPALVAACAVTGCDANAIQAMLQAETGTLTDEELQDAMRSQALTLGDLTTRIDTTTDAKLAADLGIQLTAEAEITAVYRSELRARLQSR